MKEKSYKRIVIKVGTHVITSEDGYLNTNVIADIVKQVAALKRRGCQVILVSSGAMAAGREILCSLNKDQILERQILAAVGQVKLMDVYNSLFQKEGLLCAQLLTTKEDFRTRHHYLNMKNCLTALLTDCVIPVVNENDVVSVQELMFTDNDELSGLLAAMMDCEAVFFLTSTEGLYDRSPREKGAKLISEIDAGDLAKISIAATEKTRFGRGGMKTKCSIAKKLSDNGISTYILKGQEPSAVLKIIEGDKIGTKIPGKKKTSNLKRWMAYSDGTEKGYVVVNKGAEDIMLSQKAASLLPVGIKEVYGEFEKGDLINIKSEAGVIIGIGLARYDNKLARENAGQKDKKPLIHYDSLYIY